MTENIVKQVQEEEKTYAELWRDTEAIALPSVPGQPTRYLAGSKGLTKMIMFAQTNSLDNKLIKQLMDIDPRDEGEDMKLTSQFQKALLKHRERIYKFPSLSTKQVKRNLRKIREEDAIIPPKNRKERRAPLQKQIQ